MKIAKPKEQNLLEMTNYEQLCIHNLLLERIYSIIEDVAQRKNNKKGEWSYILNTKLKYYTKEILKYFNIVVIAFGFIIAIILIKYKPMYKVSISGEEVGYIQAKEAFIENIKNNLKEESNKNIESIDVKTEPEYELKLVNRTLTSNEEEVAKKVEENIEVTYKYYEIASNNETIEKVNTKEEAEEIVNNINEENKEDVSIIEKYTQNGEDVETSTVEVAKTNIQEKLEQKKEEQKQKEEQEAKKKEEETAIANINGIKIATKPISGTITSRYGVSSSIRKSTHTGLDISATTGTPIKAVASGTVTCASYTGSYGNLVKIDHGNGVETWYGHTSKMYVKVGQKISSGDVIAAVGSTGNSTGPHLHLEIRINGTHVNPQKYLYN